MEEEKMQTYNFGNIVEGECNHFACIASRMVAEAPIGSTSYNPLFIHSETGMGKTLFAHAIGQEIKANHPEATVVFVNGDVFVQQYAEARRTSSREAFLNHYKQADVLIVDNVQFLACKEKTQAMFFSIFNHLIQRKKQIVITADKSPVDLQGFEPRLLARFKWSLVTELTVPDLTTRTAILNRRLERLDAQCPQEVVDYIALRVISNIRELEDAMMMILADASANHREIDVDMAKEVIDKYVKSAAAEISIEYIQKIVYNYFQIPLEAINSNARSSKVAQPRQICMYFAKKYTQLPLSTIGQECGGKNHTTVMHACNVIKNLYETDRRMRIDIDEINKLIRYNGKLN